jgi:hypothetical protein
MDAPALSGQAQWALALAAVLALNTSLTAAACAVCVRPRPGTLRGATLWGRCVLAGLGLTALQGLGYALRQADVPSASAVWLLVLFTAGPFWLAWGLGVGKWRGLAILLVHSALLVTVFCLLSLAARLLAPVA